MTKKEFSEKPICRHEECKTGKRCYRYNLGHKCDRCLTCIKIEGFKAGEKAGQESKEHEWKQHMINNLTPNSILNKKIEQARQDERKKVLEEVTIIITNIATHRKNTKNNSFDRVVIVSDLIEAMKKNEAKP
jgi:hypothetical protein